VQNRGRELRQPDDVTEFSSIPSARGVVRILVGNDPRLNRSRIAPAGGTRSTRNTRSTVLAILQCETDNSTRRFTPPSRPVSRPPRALLHVRDPVTTSPLTARYQIQHQVYRQPVAVPNKPPTLHPAAGLLQEPPGLLKTTNSPSAPLHVARLPEPSCPTMQPGRRSNAHNRPCESIIIHFVRSSNADWLNFT
jgi:hypothetical protein